MARRGLDFSGVLHACVEHGVLVGGHAPEARVAAQAALGAAVEVHEDGAWSVGECGVAGGQASQPLDLDPLILLAERVDRVRHPDAPACVGHLLGKQVLAEDRRPVRERHGA